VIADRGLQALASNALEPEWEARFEPRSYGFRPGRGCHDAIEAIYQAGKGASPARRWVLDADLAAAFDRIGHSFLLSQLGAFPARELAAGWLTAGVVEDGRLTPTGEGTPQGGLCSAEHNPPYAQCRIMRSAGLAGLVVAGSAGERCA
jgi:RNA-directed DNA polymerase